MKDRTNQTSGSSKIPSSLSLINEGDHNKEITLNP